MAFTLPLSRKTTTTLSTCTRCKLMVSDCEQVDDDHNICGDCMPDTCETCYEGDADVECYDGSYSCQSCQIVDYYSEER